MGAVFERAHLTIDNNKNKRNKMNRNGETRTEKGAMNTSAAVSIRV